MLTGLGSKFRVLQEFQRTALNREHCVVINGFNPAFSFSDFLNLIASRFLSFHSEGLRQDLLVNRWVVLSCVDEECVGGVRECDKPFIHRNSLYRRCRPAKLPNNRLFGWAISTSIRSCDLYNGSYSWKSSFLFVCSLPLSICISWCDNIRSLLLRNHV